MSQGGLWAGERANERRPLSLLVTLPVTLAPYQHAFRAYPPFPRVLPAFKRDPPLCCAACVTHSMAARSTYLAVLLRQIAWHGSHSCTFSLPSPAGWWPRR